MNESLALLKVGQEALKEFIKEEEKYKEFERMQLNLLRRLHK